MTRNDALVSKNDQLQERARVLGLIEAVDAARAAFQAKQRQIEASPFEHMTVSMTPEEYALQRTMHAAETRIEKLGLDTARKYADALGEIERLTRALETERRSHSNTIDSRDVAQKAADELAYLFFDIDDIGEHSSSNCPWYEALERLELAREGIMAVLVQEDGHE